ncbi:MAG: cytochrome d ubiquinol oxidase subunit II [Terriglobales bacterium]
MHGTAKLAAVAYQHHRVLTGIYTVVSRSPRLQAAAVARELGVSVRTVHRVLSDAGLGFVQVRAIAVAESVTRLRQQQRTQYQSCLGNVVRGLPIGADGYFQGSFTLMLNPYAMLTGLLSLTVLAWHGLNLMRTKAEGDLEERARRLAGRVVVGGTDFGPGCDRCHADAAAGRAGELRRPSGRVEFSAAGAGRLRDELAR